MANPQANPKARYLAVLTVSQDLKFSANGITDYEAVTAVLLIAEGTPDLGLCKLVVWYQYDNADDCQYSTTVSKYLRDIS